MRRALILLGGGPLQEPGHRYDHPYFGQIFLASLLGLTGYPHSLNLSANDGVGSIEMIHLVPRLLMGVLAVVDTFLIYKIADYRYNRNVAFIAAILFAVMPSSWFIRRIFLESIQLPLILSSILFAVYLLNRKNTHSENNVQNKSIESMSIALVLASGVFMGMAIFTKIPAFTFIPVVAYLVYIGTSNKSKNLRIKTLCLWFIPVVLIPAIWPAYALSVGEYEKWTEGLSYQLTRSDNEGVHLIDLNSDVVNQLFGIYKTDPILVILGVSGIAYAAFKRDFFSLLWIAPTLIFFYFTGFVRTFYLIPLLPVFCVAAAILVGNLVEKASLNRKRIKQPLFVAVSSAIVVFGLVSTTTLITINVNSAYFELYSSIVQNLPASNVSSGYYHADINNSSNKDKDKNIVSVVGNDWVISGFSWIPKYIYGKEAYFNKFYTRIQSQSVILVIDKRFNDTVMNIAPSGYKGADIDQKNLAKLRDIYNKSDLVARFNSKNTQRYNFDQYPYYSMRDNKEISGIEIRMNY